MCDVFGAEFVVPKECDYAMILQRRVDDALLFDVKDHVSRRAWKPTRLVRIMYATTRVGHRKRGYMRLLAAHLAVIYGQ
jgi:hypothetical protein